jgi:hypothetical protein
MRKVVQAEVLKVTADAEQLAAVEKDSKSATKVSFLAHQAAKRLAAAAAFNAEKKTAALAKDRDAAKEDYAVATVKAKFATGANETQLAAHAKHTAMKKVAEVTAKQAAQLKKWRDEKEAMSRKVVATREEERRAAKVEETASAQEAAVKQKEKQLETNEVKAEVLTAQDLVKELVIKKEQRETNRLAIQEASSKLKDLAKIAKTSISNLRADDYLQCTDFRQETDSIIRAALTAFQFEVAISRYLNRMTTKGRFVRLGNSWGCSRHSSDATEAWDACSDISYLDNAAAHTFQTHAGAWRCEATGLSKWHAFEAGCWGHPN